MALFRVSAGILNGFRRTRPQVQALACPIYVIGSEGGRPKLELKLKLKLNRDEMPQFWPFSLATHAPPFCCRTHFGFIAFVLAGPGDPVVAAARGETTARLGEALPLWPRPSWVKPNSKINACCPSHCRNFPSALIHTSQLAFCWFDCDMAQYFPLCTHVWMLFQWFFGFGAAALESLCCVWFAVTENHSLERRPWAQTGYKSTLPLRRKVLRHSG